LFTAQVIAAFGRLLTATLGKAVAAANLSLGYGNETATAYFIFRL
jgi:hypothetical protein